MKSISVGNAMACEYIAPGESGKLNIINAYSGNIQVMNFPATFPLAFYIELLPDGSQKREMKINVFVGTKSIANASIEIDEIEPDGVGVIALPALKIEFEKPTEIRVQISCEGFRKTVAIKKKVLAAPLSK